MSHRILQNNHLYRRIQYRNIFQTFSKSYKKKSLSQLRDNQENNSNPMDEGGISINKTITNLDKTKAPSIKNDNYTQRIQSQVSYPVLNKKLSTNLIHPSFEIQSKTAPINFETSNHQLQPHFRRECHTSMSSKNPTSESVLTKWNEKRKNQNFKLRSCLEKNKLKYDCIADQTQFSTLQVKKRSEILSKRENRYYQRWRYPMQKEGSSEIQKAGLTASSKGEFVFSRLALEGQRTNMQNLLKIRK